MRGNAPEYNGWSQSCEKANALLTAILSVINPEVYRAGCECLVSLQDHPDSGIAQAVPKWGTPFSGVSAIFNRCTPLHRDPQGGRTMMDLLLSVGPYDNAAFELLGVSARFLYKSGTLIGVPSRTIAHGASVADGERVCFAYFMREKVMG